jgi:hypothetical protein
MKQPTFEMTLDLIAALSQAIGMLQALKPDLDISAIRMSLNGALEYYMEDNE